MYYRYGEEIIIDNNGNCGGCIQTSEGCCNRRTTTEDTFTEDPLDDFFTIIDEGPLGDFNILSTEQRGGKRMTTTNRGNALRNLRSSPLKKNNIVKSSVRRQNMQNSVPFGRARPSINQTIRGDNVVTMANTGNFKNHDVKTKQDDTKIHDINKLREEIRNQEIIKIQEEMKLQEELKSQNVVQQKKVATLENELTQLKSQMAAVLATSKNNNNVKQDQQGNFLL